MERSAQCGGVFCGDGCCGSAQCILSFVSNISFLAELADILHYRNCNIHSSHLVVVSELSCNFHIRKNIGKRLSALFLPVCVRS